jgi:hypothetical protein
MPRKITIDGKAPNGGIQIIGDANHDSNLSGNLKEYKRHTAYLFDGLALDTTNDWAVTNDGTGDSIAISEVQGGSCLITTGSVDDDSNKMATPIIYSGTKNAVFEAKIKISDVSGTALFVGFSDAKTEANNSIAIHYASDTLTSVATDAVGFVCDSDSATAGASMIMCEGVKNGTDETSVSTGTTWADGETKTLRVELVGDEATFYLDGVRLGYMDNALTATTLMCFTVQAMTRANDGSNTVYVYRVDIWQDE